MLIRTVLTVRTVGADDASTSYISTNEEYDTASVTTGAAIEVVLVSSTTAATQENARSGVVRNRMTAATADRATKIASPEGITRTNSKSILIGNGI